MQFTRAAVIVEPVRGVRILLELQQRNAATNRVVASLPTARVRVLRLQFVDHDARLLIASATLGRHQEMSPDPSSLSFSVWDLASKALVNDIEVHDTPLATAASMQVAFSPQIGALFTIDERRDIVQFVPGTCGVAPRVRGQVGDDVGASFAVDPYGRWFASSRPLDAARDTAELATGARWALVVQDMATGRQLERVTSKYALNGLVATPDGGNDKGRRCTDTRNGSSWARSPTASWTRSRGVFSSTR